MVRRAGSDSVAGVLNLGAEPGFPQVELALRPIVVLRIEYRLTAGCR